jgi:uncharacterized protein
MLTEPLPTILDVRKAAAREVSVSGAVALSGLSRLQDMLSVNDGHDGHHDGRIEAFFRFYRDEENRFIVAVKVAAELAVLCQRCLETMPVSVRSENRLAIVGDDDTARQLPTALDPWVVEGEFGDLWALVEDELILALPVVAYHDTEACKQLLDAYRRPPVADENGDNPFKVLERLKAGTTQQEK